MVFDNQSLLQSSSEATDQWGWVTGSSLSCLVFIRLGGLLRFPCLLTKHLCQKVSLHLCPKSSSSTALAVLQYPQPGGNLYEHVSNTFRFRLYRCHWTVTEQLVQCHMFSEMYVILKPTTVSSFQFFVSYSSFWRGGGQNLVGQSKKLVTRKIIFFS